MFDYAYQRRYTYGKKKKYMWKKKINIINQANAR